MVVQSDSKTLIALLSLSRHSTLWLAAVTHLVMATGILRVEGDKVVGTDGKPVILRGAGLGGWMKCVDLAPQELFPSSYSAQRSFLTYNP